MPSRPWLAGTTWHFEGARQPGPESRPLHSQPESACRKRVASTAQPFCDAVSAATLDEEFGKDWKRSSQRLVVRQFQGSFAPLQGIGRETRNTGLDTASRGGV